jgi:hypothetical protein
MILEILSLMALKYNLYPIEENNSRLLYRNGFFDMAIWENINKITVIIIDREHDITLYKLSIDNLDFDFSPMVKIYLGCDHDDPDRHILQRKRKKYNGETARIDVQDGENTFSVYASVIECASILDRLQKRFGIYNVTPYAIGPVKASIRSDGRIVAYMDQSVFPYFRKVDNYESD